MRRPVRINRAHRRRQRLRKHLAAEYLRRTDVVTFTQETIVIEGFQLQQVEQIGEYGIHKR